MHERLGLQVVGELDRAAAVVATHSLRLSPGDRVVIFADESSLAIADALSRAGRAAQAHPEVARLDELGPRPLKVVPAATVRALAVARASVFVAAAEPGELPMRQHLLHLVRELRLRHAHMPGIGVARFAHGLRGDLGRVAAYGERLLAKLSRRRVIRSESASGTNLIMTVAPPGRWFAQLGVLEPGRWGNLPAGALYASPETIDGVFVANASLGEFFGAREGLLSRNPVRFTIRDGRVEKVEAKSLQLVRDIESILSCSASSRRVGLVCIGVNGALPGPLGDPLVDQNLPGLHLAIGDPAASATGATWSAPTSFAACQADSSVLVDEAIVVHRGRVPALV